MDDRSHTGIPLIGALLIEAGLITMEQLQVCLLLQSERYNVTTTNPVMLIIAILMILGWKVAGLIGVDRWLLPALGTPWQPGGAFEVLKRPN